MTTWNSDPDRRGGQNVYHRRNGRERETRSGNHATIRLPMEIERQRDGKLSRIVSELQSHRPFSLQSWNETSNPFIEGNISMYGIMNDQRERLEEALERSPYEWVFIERAQFRFHPYGCEGHYVVLPEDWDGDWPQTDR